MPETHRHTLGAYNMTPEAQAIYARADLMIVVGSRLRGNETRNNTMRLPRPLVQIDADAGAGRRATIRSTCSSPPTPRLALEGLLRRACPQSSTSMRNFSTVAAARAQSEAKLAAALGPYRVVADALRAARVAQAGIPSCVT